MPNLPPIGNPAQAGKENHLNHIIDFAKTNPKIIIDYLLEIIPGNEECMEEYMSINAIHGQYNQSRQDYIQGTIGEGDYSMNINRLKYKLTVFINNIEKKIDKYSNINDLINFIEKRCRRQHRNSPEEKIKIHIDDSFLIKYNLTTDEGENDNIVHDMLNVLSPAAAESNNENRLLKIHEIISESNNYSDRLNSLAKRKIGEFLYNSISESERKKLDQALSTLSNERINNLNILFDLSEIKEKHNLFCIPWELICINQQYNSIYYSRIIGFIKTQLSEDNKIERAKRLISAYQPDSLQIKSLIVDLNRSNCFSNEINEITNLDTQIKVNFNSLNKPVSRLEFINEIAKHNLVHFIIMSEDFPLYHDNVSDRQIKDIDFNMGKDDGITEACVFHVLSPEIPFSRIYEKCKKICFTWKIPNALIMQNDFNVFYNEYLDGLPFSQCLGRIRSINYFDNRRYANFPIHLQLSNANL